MSLEFAVRRLAGALVLVGLALGFWVSPWFYLIPAFVGVNLFQSSFTGVCPAQSILKSLGVGRARGEHAAGGDTQPTRA